jgi:hypothetical protein
LLAFCDIGNILSILINSKSCKFICDYQSTYVWISRTILLCLILDLENFIIRSLSQDLPTIQVVLSEIIKLFYWRLAKNSMNFDKHRYWLSNSIINKLDSSKNLEFFISILLHFIAFNWFVQHKLCETYIWYRYHRSNESRLGYRVGNVNKTF